MLLFACTPEVVESEPIKESEPPPVDTEDTAPPQPPADAAQGLVTLEDGKTSEVVGWHAFTYANENAAFVYLTGSMDASCAELEGWFLRQENPTPLFAPGTCNLQIAAPDGMPLSFELPAVTTATFQLQCPLGTGVFAEDNGTYKWSGDWWAGNADSGTVDLYASGAVVTGSIDLQSFNGSYPYESGSPAVRATGPVAGTILGEACEGLSAHPYFQ